VRLDEQRDTTRGVHLAGLRLGIEGDRVRMHQTGIPQPVGELQRLLHLVGLDGAGPLAGHNLWGGPTYVDPDRGYVELADHGQIRHDGWVGDLGDGFTEELTWLDPTGKELVREVRTIAINGDKTALRIDFRSELTSATGAPVTLATPAQYGRSDGGYGGLFLRLSTEFVLDKALAQSNDDDSQGSATPGTEPAPAVSGLVAAAFIVSGRIGDERVTLTFLDGPGGTVPPSRWLFRFGDYSAVCWAAAYERQLIVPQSGSLVFSHQLEIATHPAT